MLAYLLLYMHLDVPRRPRESRHVLTDVLSRNTQTKEGKIGSNTERNYVRAQRSTHSLGQRRARGDTQTHTSCTFRHNPRIHHILCHPAFVYQPTHLFYPLLYTQFILPSSEFGLEGEHREDVTVRRVVDRVHVVRHVNHGHRGRCLFFRPQGRPPSQCLLRSTAGSRSHI